MGRVTDAIITYAILRKFVMPIKDTQAYKLGIVDETGAPTAKANHLVTEAEQDAYTLLDRLIFKIKRIFKSRPEASKLLAGYATALAFIKEGLEKQIDEIELTEEMMYARSSEAIRIFEGRQAARLDDFMLEQLSTDVALVCTLVEMQEAAIRSGATHITLRNPTIMEGFNSIPLVDTETFTRCVLEDAAVAAGGGEAPGNVTSQVQGLETEPVFTKQAQHKWTQQNKGRKIEVIEPFSGAVTHTY